MLGFIIVCIVFLILDTYVFKGVYLLTSKMASNARMIIHISYWAINVAVLGMFIYIMLNFQTIRAHNPRFLMTWASVFVVLLVPKISFLLFHIVDDLVHVVRWAINKYSGTNQIAAEGSIGISRAKFITQVGLGVGGIMFGSFLYGVTKGKFAFRVLREKMTFSNLPKAFDGLKIVQISDLHLGSFLDDIEPIERAIRMINNLKPDYILFTGDMVNNHAEEALPWIDVFKKLKAKEGVFSVFGNHDYADYGDYSPEEKRESIASLKDTQKKMGFRLLEDETVELERDGEKISLIGVHNWGKGFHQVGDLKKAMSNTNPDHFKLLMSHDPTHWEEQVRGKENIDLTFSGHTHGMQMGIEIPSLGIKISPARLIYKRWAGLYTEDKQHLYINRGFGVMAFPGRVGIAPEITLIELKSKA